MAGVGSLPAAPVAAARYAGFWPRAGAWVIDQLVIAIPFNIVTDLLVSYHQPTVTTTTDANNNVSIHWHGDWRTLGLLLLASIVATWLYTSILQSSSRQATRSPNCARSSSSMKLCRVAAPSFSPEAGGSTYAST